MFFPGETITHRFVIPFAVNEIDKVILSYKQKEAIIFEKTLYSGFVAEEPSVTSVEFQLTQGEGLLFLDDAPFTVQVNVVTKQNTRHTSHELSSSSGVQYLREVLNPEAMRITEQPTNQTVYNYCDIVTFSVQGVGIIRYDWQYSVSGGEWKPCTYGTAETLVVVATEERVSTHRYRCVCTDVYNNSTATNVVKINYIDRSDE